MTAAFVRRAARSAKRAAVLVGRGGQRRRASIGPGDLDQAASALRREQGVELRDRSVRSMRTNRSGRRSSTCSPSGAGDDAPRRRGRRSPGVGDGVLAVVAASAGRAGGPRGSRRRRHPARTGTGRRPSIRATVSAASGGSPARATIGRPLGRRSGSPPSRSRTGASVPTTVRGAACDGGGAGASDSTSARTASGERGRWTSVAHPDPAYPAPVTSEARRRARSSSVSPCRSALARTRRMGPRRRRGRRPGRTSRSSSRSCRHPASTTRSATAWPPSPPTVAPFEVAFARVARFAGVVWLEPEPASRSAA